MKPKRKRVAIIGYGVVGRGMERLLEKHFDVIPYDTNGEKLNANGTQTKSLVNECELAIICVPTPMSADGSCDVSAVKETLAWLTTPLILIKSTVPPGFTDFMNNTLGCEKICFSPEYMGESSYYTPFWKYPDPEDARSHTFVIIGGNEKVASQIMNYFMKVMSVDTNYQLCTAKEAELTKYMENTFFATKVTFCNEFYNIAKSFGVEYKKLRELWLLDPRINRMHTAVFEDSRGFGGKCYPKDLNGIIKAAESVGYEPTLLKQVKETNELFRK